MNEDAMENLKEMNNGITYWRKNLCGNAVTTNKMSLASEEQKYYEA